MSNCGCNKTKCGCPSKCDMCCKQPKIAYCGVSIGCLGIKKGDDIHNSIRKIGDWICEQQAGVTGESIIEITYTEGLGLINNSLLSKGSLYKITDRGIYLHALENNMFETHGTKVKKTIKSEVYFPTTVGSIKGVFNTTSVTTGDIYVWGSKVWRTLSTAIGVTPVDDYTIGSNFVEDLTDSYYETTTLFIEYDYINDFIIKASDLKGNTCIGMTLSVNPLIHTVDYCDWGGLKVVNAFNNIFTQYLNNVVTPSETMFNNNVKNIIGNVRISLYNNFIGDIISNIDCSIYKNNMLGSILKTRASVPITTPIGIYNNNITGDIVDNDIVMDGLSINNNINNGNIGSHSFTTSRSTSVFDTIVNK